jgi:plastocyanin
MPGHDGQIPIDLVELTSGMPTTSVAGVKAVRSHEASSTPALRPLWIALISTLAALWPVGTQLTAETHHVTVDGGGFVPAMLTIQVGDTVVWENTDDFDFSHTTTSTLEIFDPNYWNGILVGWGDTFAHTFNRAGTFHYVDLLDSGTGTVTVLPAVVAPEIRLESPRLVNGQFVFDASGLSLGRSYALLASIDLKDWFQLTTHVAVGPILTFTNATGLGQLYFRVTELE